LAPEINLNNILKFKSYISWNTTPEEEYIVSIFIVEEETNMKQVASRAIGSCYI
jgi:hypothetical protein